MELPVSFIFKPFEKRMAPNFIAKINLNDPSVSLDMVFGPPIPFKSNDSRQNAPIIRYGSQAVGSQFSSAFEVTTDSVVGHEEAPPVYSPIMSKSEVFVFKEKQ